MTKHKDILIKPFQVYLTAGTVEKLKQITGMAANHEAIQIGVLEYIDLYGSLEPIIEKLKKLTGKDETNEAIVAAVIELINIKENK